MPSAEKINRCADWIEERLDALPSQPLGLSDAPDSHLHVIVGKAGNKKVTPRVLEDLTRAFQDRGIHAFPRLSDPGVDRNTRIYFSRDKGTFEGMGLPHELFDTETAMQKFFSTKFAAVLPELELRKSQYAVDPPRADKIDLLALDKKARELVAIELKHQWPDKGVVEQMGRYVRALRIQAEREGLNGARGLLITGQPDRRVLESLQELARGSETRIDWMLYRFGVKLFAAPGS